MKSIASVIAVSALVAANAFAGPVRPATASPGASRTEALPITHNMAINGSVTDLALAQAPARRGPLRLFTTNGPTNVFDSTEDPSGVDIAVTERAAEPAVAEAPTVVVVAPGPDIASSDLAAVPVVVEASTVVVAGPGPDIAFTELAAAPVVADAPALFIAADLAPSVTAVPEPGTVALLGLGLVGCAIVRRSRAGRP